MYLYTKMRIQILKKNIRIQFVDASSFCINDYSHHNHYFLLVSYELGKSFPQLIQDRTSCQ